LAAGPERGEKRGKMTMGITRVEWTYRDNTYGMECKPADVDDLLKEVATRVGEETRDGMIGRLMHEISGDPDNKNSWIPLGLTLLWFACSEDKENLKGFSEHA
jgi:hypothetical protein